MQTLIIALLIAYVIVVIYGMCYIAYQSYVIWRLGRLLKWSYDNEPIHRRK